MVSDFGGARSLLQGGITLLAVAFLIGCGAGDSDVEPSRANKAEVAIRSYLAEEFLYETWYPQVGGIDVAGRRASVATSLEAGGRSRGTARKICAAVLLSGEVKKVSVKFDSRTQTCP
jgi:hypothetical protein